jgi:hypothetical protein
MVPLRLSENAPAERRRPDNGKNHHDDHPHVFFFHLKPPYENLTESTTLQPQASLRQPARTGIFRGKAAVILKPPA